MRAHGPDRVAELVSLRVAREAGHLGHAVHVLPRLRIALLAVIMAMPAVAPGASLADADAMEALDAYAGAVAGLQADLLALCESAAPAQRFELYRSYNHSVGTTLQVEFLRQALRQALAANDQGDMRRAELAQQARFTLWEIEQHIATLQDAGSVDDARARIEAALLDVLQDVRGTVTRLAR